MELTIREFYILDVIQNFTNSFLYLWKMCWIQPTQKTFNEMLQMQPVYICSHLKCHILWMRHGGIVVPFHRVIRINSGYLVLKVRFRGASENLQATEITAIHKSRICFWFLSLSTAIVLIWVQISPSPHNCLRRQVAFIFHVYLATSDREIWMTGFVQCEIAQQRDVTRILALNWRI